MVRSLAARLACRTIGLSMQGDSVNVRKNPNPHDSISHCGSWPRAIAAAVALSLAAACATTHGAEGGGAKEAGAATPRKAVDDFLAAIHAKDLQAMSMVWGTDHGPARDAINRD